MLGLPLELITMLGSTVLGGVMSIWGQSIKARQAEQKMLMERANANAGFVQQAREAGKNDKHFAWTRRLIALSAVFAIIVLPKLVAVFYPEVGVYVGYTEIQTGFFDFIFGPGEEVVKWKYAQGFVITPLDTHIVSAIVGLYFGAGFTKQDITMPDMFNAPIPGESLTTEPGNYPWEQPPLHADPMDALEYHMEQLTDEKVTDNVIDMMDIGVPVEIIADTLLTSAIMNGIHSVDVKMLLKPVMHMQIKALGDVAGIDYKEYMSDYDDKEEMARIKRQQRIAAKLGVQSKLSGAPKDKGDMIEADVAEMLMNEPQEEEMASDTETTAPEQGIMAKEQM